MFSRLSVSEGSRRPAPAWAAALVAGIVAGLSGALSPGAWLAGGIGCWLGAYSNLARVASVWFILLGALCGGAALAGLDWGYYPAHHIASWSAPRPQIATLRVRLDQPPKFYDGAAGGGIQLAGGQVTQILAADGWQPACGAVRLSFHQADTRLADGQTLELTGLLSRPAAALNPSEFDFAFRDRQQRIVAQVVVPYRCGVKVIQEGSAGLLSSLHQYALSRLEAGLPREANRALLAALVLGESDPELTGLYRQFIATGVSHHLAISGMHVALVGALAWGLARCVGFSPRRGVAWGLAVVLAYGLAVNPSPPVWRSVLLALVMGGGLLAGLPTDALQLLGMTVIAMLMAYPLDLLQPGFQLSFGTVLGLMLLSSPLDRWLTTWRDPDVVIAEQWRPPRGAWAAWRWTQKRLRAVAAAALVAWAVSAPLIAVHFWRLNPWSIIAGLFMAPPVMLALGGGVLKIVLTALMPWGAAWWALVPWWGAQAMSWLVGWMARWPGGDRAIASPFWLLPLIFYALLLTPLWPAARQYLGKWLMAAPAAAIGLLLTILVGQVPQPPAGEARWTHLAVGAANCAVGQMPDGSVIMVDCGGAAQVYDRIIDPFLRRRGIRAIHTLFITHPNVDHYMAAEQLIEAGRVRRVAVGPYFVQQCRGEAAGRLLAAMERADCELITLSPGKALYFGPAQVRCIWPPTARSNLNENDASLVLLWNYAGRSMLFTGDIARAARQALAGQWHQDQARENPMALSKPSEAGTHCDCLVAPHHGSYEADDELWLAAARPAWVYCSADATPTGKQRRFATLFSSGYAQAGKQLVHSNQAGAVQWTIDPTGATTLSTFRQSK